MKKLIDLLKLKFFLLIFGSPESVHKFEKDHMAALEYKRITVYAPWELIEKQNFFSQYHMQYTHEDEQGLVSVYTTERSMHQQNKFYQV